MNGKATDGFGAERFGTSCLASLLLGHITEYIWFWLRPHPSSSLRSKPQIYSNRYIKFRTPKKVIIIKERYNYVKYAE